MRHEQIDALAKAIWQRESPAKIYAALSGLFEPEAHAKEPDGYVKREHYLADLAKVEKERDAIEERCAQMWLRFMSCLEQLRDEPWNRHEIIRTAVAAIQDAPSRPNKAPHINADGQFQSDKYPTCPPGKVPLSVKDKTAQDLLWTYAQRRRAVDAEFADDLETCLKAEGYEPQALTMSSKILPGSRVRVTGDVAWEDIRGKFATVKRIAEGGQVAEIDVDGVIGLHTVAVANLTLVEEGRETDFKPDWSKYRNLELAMLRCDLRLQSGEHSFVDADLRNLLREARAEAVRLIADVNAEELLKARRAGAEEQSKEREKAENQAAVLQVRCENLQRELDADTGIIRSHIALRTKVETERDHLKLVVACAWRAYHGGFITDAVAELYATLVRYAPDGDLPSDLPAPNGEWVHCSPELLAIGIDCGTTKRRPCMCEPPGSHDHWVVREPIVVEEDQEERTASPETHRFRITIRNTAGRILEDGKSEAIVASRGRVFYVNDETIGGATAKFYNAGIPATERYPATPVLATDFDIVLADETDIPEKAIENWTGARPG